MMGDFNERKSIFEYLIIVINVMLMMFFAGTYYHVVGICLIVAYFVTIAFFKDSKLGCYIVMSQIKSYDKVLFDTKKERNSLLLSIAFLIISIKIGAAIALFVEGAAVIILAFCILVASGWLIEGYASGMTIGFAYNISKLVLKIYLFLTSLTDKLAMLLVKIEFSALKIEEA